MREVAEVAGVAMSSVSRVLSGHPDVSPAMRQRVLAAVEQLGYKPNLLAQSLRRQETLSVGFVVRDISNPLMAEIVKSAETRLRESRYALLLTNSESDPELDADHIRLFQQRRVDGLILSLTSETHPRTTSLLENLDIPCVLVDRDVPASVRSGVCSTTTSLACAQLSATCSISGIGGSTSFWEHRCARPGSGGQGSRRSSQRAAWRRPIASSRPASSPPSRARRP